ncbi:MAG TPA: ASKHA domain-containing protein [Dehalococcoidales bacterium]|nr:ASKHA domain-containing protein [Dehalococcoidales bacterium]
MKVRIRVLPTGRDLELKAGANLRTSLIEAGIALDSPCGGQGTCLKCKVQVSGISQKFTELEEEKLSAEELHNGWRLACQTTVEEAGEVCLPEMEVSRAKASFSLLGEEISVQPNAHRRHFELSEPVIGDQRADWDRLAEYLDISEPAPVEAELPLLREISERLREWNFKGEAVMVGDTVTALDPPESAEGVLGLALDIGTTTLAAGLVDLETGKVVAIDAELNPQIAFGADVISRIVYTRDSHEKREELQKELIKGLNRLLLRVCRLAGRERERIFEATVVGNTTMLHSLLGLDALHIALAPYVGVLNQSLSIPAGELGLQIHPRGRVHILPAIASFVGADTVAVILAARLYQTSVPKLAVDIGTNGEVMLATRDKILTASTAAGPAFEGGRIKFGMRAIKGAISSFQATPSFSYAVIGSSMPRGICGSGLMELVAELFRAGVIDRKGRMLLSSETDSSLAAGLAQRVRVQGEGREFVIFKDKETEITLTQQDVRELQLAKGAIRAGIELLVKEANIKTTDIQEVLLSGVFGNYINREKAVMLGLLPQFPLEKIHFIGNGAMDGALRALINLEERRRADEISESVYHVELSGRPDFEETFLRCLELGA